MNNEKLGLYIKHKRLQLGFNRPQFGELTAINPDYLNNIEHGSTPSTTILLQIASGLGIRPGVLIDVLAGYADGDVEINSLNAIRLPDVLINEIGDIQDIKDYVEFKAGKRLALNIIHNNKVVEQLLRSMNTPNEA